MSSFSPANLRSPAFAGRNIAASQTVRFSGIGGGALGAAAPLLTKAAESEAGQGLLKTSRWKWALAGLLGLGILSGGAAEFNTQIAQMMQSSHGDTVSLSQVQHPAGQQAEANQLLDWLKAHPKAHADPDLLKDLARLGFVDEIISDDPLPNAPESGVARVVLKDGRVLEVTMDSALQAQLREDFGVDTVHSNAYGFPALADPKIAGGIAGLGGLMGAGAMLLLESLIAKRRQKDPRFDEQDDRYYIEAIGRFLVAHELGLKDSGGISGKQIEEGTSLLKNVDPLTRSTVEKRLAVLAGGYHAERNTYGDDISAESDNNVRVNLPAAAKAAVEHLGMTTKSNVNPLEAAKASAEDSAAEALAVATRAFNQAEAIIKKYDKSQLDLLGEALQRIRDLQMNEAQDLLNGQTTIEDLEKSRTHFQKGKTKQEKAIVTQAISSTAPASTEEPDAGSPA